MTRDEARRLELARKAWRAGEPDEAELERAVRRLSRRLSERGARDPARRVLSFGVALLVFGAALAYAASGGVKLPFGSAPPPPVPAETPPGALGAALAPSAEPARQDVPATESETPPDDTANAAPVEAPPAPRGKIATRAASKRPRAVAPEPEAQADSQPEVSPPQAPEPAEVEAPPPEPAEPSASWGDVSRALAAKDDRGARKALESLGQSSDAATRAKARLGLAQLAASRGDCVRARAIANEVATGNDADPRTAERARALARRCAR